MATDKDVAEWMLAQINKDGVLSQDFAAHSIEQKFGQDFIYDNDAGNAAIAKSVLAIFKNLTRDTVVWERSERLWRPRQGGDDPGRMQA